MTNRVAQRLKRIPPYAFATISARVRELQQTGHDVIRIDMGSPDLPPHPDVVAQLIRSAQEDTKHGYAGYSGIPQLREAFADYYLRRFGVELDPEREVLPLIGSKEGLVNIMLALLDPGDIVLVPDPGYPTYAMGAALVGGEPVYIRLDPRRGYAPDLESIAPEIAERARILWVNYPNNPTGAAVPLSVYEDVVAFCREHAIVVASDNPYSDLTFDGIRPPSLLQAEGAREVGVEFNSMSKTFNMAGWRVGVAVGAAPLIDALLRVKSNIDSGLFRAIQDAAIVALHDTPRDWIDERNLVYQQRRDFILEQLPSLGLSAETPRGGLYVWARVPDGDDEGFAEGALEHAHVSMAPGSLYGERGRGFVRMSIVAPLPRLEEAFNRLRAWRG